ncbi:MAG: dihydrolipoyl dehydrogenase [Synergistaceae bacterium]|jgi:dihydrolipoamide dehydrogenase|nr:dihydrolipoyl dehydrogenase [Synergistaceae bacterium]
MGDALKIAVIGGGPGGYVAAIRAAQLGADVTLIERGSLGGTCLNVGCIPTKALLHTARLLDGIRQGREIGVSAVPEVDFAQVQKHKGKIVKKLTGGVGMLMKANGVAVLNGSASFDGERAISVKGEDGAARVSPDRIIIATGSKPAVPPIPGIESSRCVDSSGALSFEGVPKSMAVIGGGVIGVELASIYSSFGAKVTLIEAMPEILPLMDSEMAGMLRKLLARRGVETLVSAKVESIEDGDGTARVNVSAGGGRITLEAEKILFCTGRRPDTEGLALDSAGIAHDRGRVIADSRMRTNVPWVYAAGDCTGGVMLAHAASAQGETAAEGAMGLDAEYDGTACPSCVYADPEFASAGLSEDEARRRGLAYSAGKFPLAANGKALIENGGEGAVKILSDLSSGKILGLHILGARATDMIAEGALAIGLGATISDIASTVHAHPTVSEAVREAALASRKEAIHILNR